MNLEFYNSKRPFREIRTVYNDDTIRVYQAFSKEIAIPALDAQTFVPPFKTDGVVSWVKPSFLWCMKRTHWGKYTRISKKNTAAEEEDNAIVLGIEIKRDFFDYLLSIAFITHREDFPEIDNKEWSKKYQNAGVRVQWDPEKNFNGSERNFKAIQIGIKGKSLVEYTQNIVRMYDMKDLINEIKAEQDFEKQIQLLPDEKPYPISDEIYERLNMREVK